MNWTALIDDLLSRGWTQEMIASEVGRPQSWVSDVYRARYKDLRWSDGEALIALHRRTLKRASRNGPTPPEEAAHG